MPEDPAPPLAPLLDSGRLRLPDGAELAYELSGAWDGVPALYLHGGPGSALSSGYRGQVPGGECLLVGFSQRGAGESTPSAGAAGAVDLSTNTTAQLVADIEALREHLGISAWIVQGISWGSTLALAYAQAHPERVLGVVLFAVTTTSRREVEWICEEIGAVFPEAWDELASFAERHGDFDRRDRSAERVPLVEAYRRMLASSDPELVEGAAEAWVTWEEEHMRIGTGQLRISRPRAPATESQRAQRRTFARLVTHYWAHDGFVADWPARFGGRAGTGLLGGMERLAGVPGILIHGRRDVSGPTLTAWELHRAWPGSELHVIEDEGHGGPEMVAQWRAAMHRLVAANTPLQ